MSKQMEVECAINKEISQNVSQYVSEDGHNNEESFIKLDIESFLHFLLPWLCIFIIFFFISYILMIISKEETCVWKETISNSNILNVFVSLIISVYLETIWYNNTKLIFTKLKKSWTIFATAIIALGFFLYAIFSVFEIIEFNNAILELKYSLNFTYMIITIILAISIFIILSLDKK